jgi:hypothetical protein
MPEISRFYGILIAMFWAEHNPPHFHARYGEHKAAIEIDTLRVLDGWLPPRALGYRIELEFDDGERGVVDLTKYVEGGGVFEQIKDMEVFREFSVNEELGTLTWGNELDIAPETLYAEVTGGNLPEWMESGENETANQRLQQGPLDGSRFPDR